MGLRQWLRNRRAAAGSGDTYPTAPAVDAPAPAAPMPPAPGGAPLVQTRVTVNGQPAAMTPELAAFVRQAEELATRMPGPGEQRVTVTGDHVVITDPTRPAPGTPGGGTTPEQALQLVGTGERATATVLSVSPVQGPPGVPMPGVGLYDLVLDVARGDGTHYQTKTRMGFSTAERRDRVARAGAQIPLRLDPTDLTRVAVDTEALGSS